MRVVIAEDLFLLRDGLTRLLEAHGLEVTAAVDNGTDLLAALTAGAPDGPDVAVVDVRLPPTFTDEVLDLMAEGRSNAAIAQRLFVTERAVAKHTASIFLKLGLQPSDDDNRRVLAVLAYLGR